MPSPGNATNEHVEPGHTRTEAQREIYERIEKDGVCPFCPKNFVYHTKPILWTSDHWLVTTNMEPYQGALHHFLLIAKEHAATLCELSLEAWSDLGPQISRLEKEYGIPSGALLIRFGDSAGNGGSVNHLHCHMIVGEATKLTGNMAIRVKVGYGIEK